jgi:hypothetical protein
VKTIWKYELILAGTQILHIPRDGYILTLQMQNNVPCIWVILDPSFPTEKLRIATYGTGQALPKEPGYYLGTYQTDGMVFHLFDSRLEDAT